MVFLLGNEKSGDLSKFVESTSWRIVSLLATVQDDDKRNTKGFRHGKFAHETENPEQAFRRPWNIGCISHWSAGAYIVFGY